MIKLTAAIVLYCLDCKPMMEKIMPQNKSSPLQIKLINPSSGIKVPQRVRSESTSAPKAAHAK